MTKTKKIVYSLITVSVLLCLKEALGFNIGKISFLEEINGSTQPQDFEENPKSSELTDTLKFPIEESKTIEESMQSASSIDLLPSQIKDSIVYDPDSNVYYIDRYLSDIRYRNATVIPAEDYRKLRFEEDEKDYFRQKLQLLSMFNQKPKLPEMSKEGIFDRLFGGTKISITPQGSVEVTANGFWENRENFLLPERQRKYFTPDFDMNMNINLVAQIGEKLKLNLSNNTSPSLLNQNMQKIELTGKEDEIIKKIEIGNVSFPLRTSLIQGVQSLFGAKTQLQFGKLWITAAASQQKSQRKSQTFQGGFQNTPFEITADDYEENKNFLLAQYFKENYNKALERYPIINTQVEISKVEVWITNRTGAVTGVRDVLSFMDLGEKNPYQNFLSSAGGTELPDNRSNTLYDQLQQNPGSRLQATATQTAQGLGLIEGQDFQRVTMRQLNQNEYTFQPKLGYLMLNSTVYPDDVLAVSFRYTHNGKVYQVGEFSDEMPPDTASQKVIFAKLIKGTANRPTLPIWDLMMKNVYYLGANNIAAEEFRLNVVYKDPGGGEKRYLPEGSRQGEPLIRLLNLDRLNQQKDPISDGVFDFVEGITINPQMGKIIFPVLEPFGNALKPSLDNNPSLEKKYLFQILYDSTKVIAQQKNQTNRFVIKGTYRSSFGGGDIFLGAFSIPEGSVSVTAGGTLLQEGADFQVDYGSGRLKILNQGILNSGLPITVQYEDNGAFGVMQQTFLGTRFDYFANEKWTFGGTYLKLSERPFAFKSRLGEDPINNTVVGADVAYQSEAPWLTRLLDKLPFYSTSAPSMVAGTIEGAAIFPGHHRFSNIEGDDGGTQFLDDFEGASGIIDLKLPAVNWSLASTPIGAKGPNGNILFPEATSINDLRYGANRANLAWYTIDPNITGTNAPKGIKGDTVLMNYWRQVSYQDIFPNRTNVISQRYVATLDLGFYPKERGAYNFDAVNINPSNGQLLNPQQRWGGIQRAIDNMNSDFEAANVEYITFWLMDPFMYNQSSQGGYLYFNLGNVSEDVLKDGRMSFENGIDNPKDPSKLEATPWGFIPKFQQQITRAFINDPTAREIQDVGLDLLNDEEETQFFNSFITQVAGIFPPGTSEYESLRSDPASDNYMHFRNKFYDDNNVSLLNRYRKFNRMQGNTPTTNDNAGEVPGQALPDGEDINRDNTLNESEAYFQYRVLLKPNMEVGQNYIVDKITTDVKLQNGRTHPEVWYQFKIPKNGYDEAVGGISDFRSIRFIRMFLNGFEDSVILRFAQLQLDRNTWRRYDFSLLNPGENIPPADLATTSFAVTTVSLEQNSNKSPVPYVMPPGIDRQLQPVSTGQNVQLDEQSLALQVCGLKDGDARAVIKDVGGLDLRQYEKLRMFIHAENVPNQTILNNGDVRAFIRIGTDFTHNYYEYQLPLQITPDGSRNTNEIWPDKNKVILDLKRLVAMKNERNSNGQPAHIPYKSVDENGNLYIIVGNPNIAEAKSVMLGVLNPKKTLDRPDDDGLRKCTEVWFNELRVSGMNEKPGYAAAASINMQLADLGNAQVSSSMHTVGYGNINQKLNDRFRDNFYQINGTTNLNFGKLMPNKWGVTLPVFFGYNQNVSSPLYDPYDKDVKLSDKINQSSDPGKVRRAAQDFNSILSFNVNNFRIMGNPEKQPKVIMPWSIKNFDFLYSYNKQSRRNALVEKDDFEDQKLGMGYTYRIKSFNITPFTKLFNERSPYWNLIKDFNFNPLPTNFTFRTELRKIFEETVVRNIDDGPYQLPILYFQNFTWERYYATSWELTKSLNLNYTATNHSRVDEPYGRLDTKEKRDSLLNNIAQLGRNVYFNHDLNVTYSLPLKKIPILDFATVNATYNTKYFWTAASRIMQEQGNVISNLQTRQINGQFNFRQLYNKSRWLKVADVPKQNVLDNPAPKNLRSKGGDMGKSEREAASEQSNVKEKEETATKTKTPAQVIPPKPVKRIITEDSIPNKDKMTKSEIRKKLRELKKKEGIRYRKELFAWRRKKQNIMPEVSDGYKFAIRTLTMVKNATVTYSEDMGTILPGYMDSARILGMNVSNFAPGAFAFGLQPSQQWLLQEASQGRFTTDSIFNAPMQQRYGQTYSIRANVEPLPDLRIDFSLNSSFRRNYNGIFKFDQQYGDYRTYNPYDMGSFNISYLGIRTMFTPLHKDKLSNEFQNLLDYRKVISERLGNSNPYTNSTINPLDPEYTKGYGRYSQDVVIPAFYAAYKGIDPLASPLIMYENRSTRSNPFRRFKPMPNWSATYNGLTKIGSLKDKIRTLTVNHAYNGSMSMNSFSSNLLFQDLLYTGFPSFIDSVSGNYIPYFMVPNITITESFAPVIGFDMQLQNSLNIKMTYNKTRTITLNLYDYQVAEMKSTEIIVGAGYRLKGLNLPFTIFGIDRLENDLNIRADFGYRDNLTVNSFMATEKAMATMGMKDITISPSIDYILNDRIQLRLFFDRRQSIPYVQNSFPITTTRAGITVRYIFNEGF